MIAKFDITLINELFKLKNNLDLYRSMVDNQLNSMLTIDSLYEHLGLVPYKDYAKNQLLKMMGDDNNFKFRNFNRQLGYTTYAVLSAILEYMKTGKKVIVIFTRECSMFRNVDKVLSFYCEKLGLEKPKVVDGSRQTNLQGLSNYIMLEDY